MEMHYQTHYMECPKCYRRIWSRSGNKDELKEDLTKHMTEPHYISDTCPKCDSRIWNDSGDTVKLREDLWKHMAEPHDVSATCPTCYKVFNSWESKRENQNCMEQHQQVHRILLYQCPLCGVQRFRAQASAVQHVESGGCPKCRGRVAARNGVYNFVATNQETRHMLSEQPRILYDGYVARYDIPKRPYKCDQCNKRFTTLGGMMHHQR